MHQIPKQSDEPANLQCVHLGVTEAPGSWLNTHLRTNDPNHSRHCIAPEELVTIELVTMSRVIGTVPTAVTLYCAVLQQK